MIDGDTIEVALDGATARVRYIGIDTPEVSGRLEPLGPEATEANRRLVDGRTVVLERDVSETDRYGRLLRYVWLREADGSRWLLVNLALTAAGYALVSTVPPDVKYADLLLAAQREARARGVGLWGAVADDAGATPSASDRSGATDDERCDPAYPGVCIPPPPPDLDCRDIDARRFAVRPPDPHRFDGDGDGIGCEG
ncbi:MAG TPA: thermonuclease family protein [Candidatus Limnocylindrales bacterium]|nr:thermonuclease family protein [Candidatus Limnocylindrales bacterium]